MKKVLLIAFIVCGLALASILPIAGLMALCSPIKVSDEETMLSTEKVSNDINKEDNEENDDIEKIEDNEEVPLAVISKNKEKELNEENNTKDTKDSKVSNEIEINKNIVDGKSVKDSFDFHKARIISQELIFMVLDGRGNITYYLDFGELNKDVKDNDKYNKEFELNDKGELIKYIYTKE